MQTRSFIVFALLTSTILFALLLVGSLQSVNGTNQQQLNIVTFEFVYAWGSYGTGPGQFNLPVALAVDEDGNIHVADRDNNRIQKFTSQGTFLLMYPTISGRVITPNGIDVGPWGYIYVADTDRERILYYRAEDGYEIGGWNDIGEPYNFREPWGVAGSNYAGGIVYAIDRFYCKIYRFSRTGNYVGSRGGCASGDYYMDSPRDVATSWPLDIALPVVYVADTGNQRIKKYTYGLDLISLWGEPGAGDGQFNEPSSVAADVNGYVYVADSDNHRIQVFDDQGNFVTKFGSQGSGDGQLESPRGIAVDNDGCVYVADTGNDRVVVFCPQTPLPTFTPVPPTDTPTPTATRTATPPPTATATPTSTPTRTSTPIPTYLIAGHVLDARGQPVSGVVISDDAGHSATSESSSGLYLLEVLAGTYTLTPYKPDFTFAPSSRTVSVPPDATQQDFNAYDKPPIVFVHGWRGLPPYPVGSCDPVDPEAYFQSVDNYLRGAGYYVEYAYLDTTPCYTPPLVENVENLQNAIASAMAATNQPKVILIAHSMGGLVSRAYIEGGAYENDVKELFTFGSPHHGIPVSAIAFLINGLSLGEYCRDYQPAVCDFTTVGMTIFNEEHSSRRRVIYHLISGDAPLSSRSALGIAMDAIIDAPNDGIVPAPSGIGYDLASILDRWMTDEVHGPGAEGAFTLGSHTYFVRGDDLSASYEQCLRPVLVDQTSATCESSGPKTVRTASNPLLSARTPMEYDTLLPGQIVTRTVHLEEGSVVFTARWLSGTLALTLVDPAGLTIDSAYATDHPDIVSYQSDEGSAVYYFPSAMAGAWQIRLQAMDIPAEGSAYATFAAFESDLTLAGGTDQLWYTPGTLATITASLSAVPVSATVTATILYGDEITETVSLPSLGAGQYQAGYTVPAAPGYADVRLVATGATVGGVPFERGTELAFQITSNSVALNGVYSDAPEQLSPGSHYYRALTVSAGVDVAVDARVGLSADLVDTDGNLVAHSVTMTDVVSGTGALTLRFDGADIYASQRNGPYTLTNLLLTDQRGATLVAAEAQDVYTTAAYDYHSFNSLLGDLNGDCTVDILDIQAIADRWGQASGPPYDLDGDGVVTVVDIMRVAVQWGNRCP